MQRKIKNVVKNYTASEIKVREATSNDPWGPSTTLMSEISTLTFDPLACSEMMNIVWKRLNDHGKNWRHVYKSLVLLDFLVRTGSERVVKQCKDNVIFIQTLRDFQYVENGLDCGLNVREAAKKLYDLLRDDDRLKNERHRANKSKSKFGDFRNFQSSAGDLSTNGNGYSLSQSSSSTNNDRKYRPFTTDEMERELHRATTTSAASGGGDRVRSPRQNAKDPEIESIRPTNQNEEEIQLQLALAMSKEQHEQEMKKIKSEQIKLQMAIEESKKTAEKERRGSSHVETRPESLQYLQYRKLWQHPSNFIENQSNSSKYNPPPSSSSSSYLAQALSDPWATTTTTSSNVKVDPWKVDTSDGSKNSNLADLFDSGPFYSAVNKPQQNSNIADNSNILFDNNSAVTTRAKYPWETGSTITKSTKNVDEFAEILHRPSVAKNAQQNSNNAGNDFFNNNFIGEQNDLTGNNNTNSNGGNNNILDGWFNGNASNDNQQKSVEKSSQNGNSNNNLNDSIEDLLNLNLSTSQQQKTKNTKKVTPEEFLGPNAKLVDFDELIAKPNPAKAINPFALTTAIKGAPQNPFAVKAQQEEKSRRVPLNQLQAGNLMADQSASSYRFENSTYSQLTSSSHEQQPNLNSHSATSLAYGTHTTSAVQNQTYNPFL